jgi:hypothetical protein
MSIITEPSIQLPLSPSAQFDNLWTMFYRHGLNSNLTKSFYFKGTIVQAEERARTHCDIMKYKLITVRALVSDLVADEMVQLS